MLEQYKTGDADSKNFTPRVQAVAKNMKKKDVKDFASTKHKGLPMKKEMLDKLKEMVRVELESCGYTHSVSGKKLKSSGGTGPEDRHLKEMSDKSKKIINKLGKKEKEMFLTMVDMMGFDQVMSDYKRDKKAFKQALKDMSENINEKKKMFPPKKMTPKQAKEYKKFIGYAKMGVEYQIDMSLFESVNEAVDWKQAEKLLGKWASGNLRSFNPLFTPAIQGLESAIKDKNEEDYQYTLKALVKGIKIYAKRTGVKAESMNPSAVKKMRDEFEKTGQLPPHLKKFALDLKILKKKHKVKNIVVPGLEWMSDMKEQSVNEARLDPKQLLQQLGGNKFIAMTGAKNLAVDKSKNELHMKIGRNSKSISHVIIRLIINGFIRYGIFKYSWEFKKN